MMNDVKFSKNVILIDVAFVNEVIAQSKKPMEEQLGRELPNIDLPAWLSYLALDAGLREGDNEIQVLLVHDEGTHTLNCCEPTDLDGLDGMACRTPLGEFVFSTVCPARITNTEDLFLDLMNLTLDSADVECLMLLPFHPSYGDRVEDGLYKFFKGKSKEKCDKAVYFLMDKLLEPLPCRSEFVAYSVLHAFGIKSEDLNKA